MPPLSDDEEEATMSSKNHNVGRELNQGFKLFLLVLAIVIAVSIVVNFLQSNILFLFLLPVVVSVIYVLYLYHTP
ncbi:hypothetical protein BRC86_01165 [Halobacteriales archaeon QS_3_64_16]|nr:MAG: hypothetical protein BRC86_01165 [Halobacteriales archaeon QS_3_64_16]